MKRQPTYSVRKGGTADLWLNSRGQWGPYANRKRFKTDDAGEQAVRQHFGPDFHNFGTFPNS